MKHKETRNKPNTLYSAYAAVSIDGRISVDSKKLPDWTSPEDWNFFQGALKKADAVVVGRGTYDVVSDRIKKRVAYVLSSKIKKPRIEGTVTFVNPRYTDLRTLLGRHKKVAIAGGAGAYQTMLDLGLLDELYLTIEPIVFGRGRTLFVGGTENTYFRLGSVRKLNDRGTIVLQYKKKK